MIVFAQVKELAAAGSAVRLDAHALTPPQWLELVAIAAQTGARIHVARAGKLAPEQRHQLAEAACERILFDFAG